MIQLVGVPLPTSGYQHGLMFFGVLLLLSVGMAVAGKSIGGAPERNTRAVLNRDQENLRYWLDAAERESADAKACRAIASVYARRLVADAALRQRYETQRKG